jgi:hypothetical protein
MPLQAIPLDVVGHTCCLVGIVKKPQLCCPQEWEWLGTVGASGKRTGFTALANLPQAFYSGLAKRSCGPSTPRLWRRRAASWVAIRGPPSLKKISSPVLSEVKQIFQISAMATSLRRSAPHSGPAALCVSAHAEGVSSSSLSVQPIPTS